MATRDAVVNVQVNTPKTLGQLESELEGINEELKQVEIGSDAFKTLASQAQRAGSEIKDLETEFEGLSFEDKTGAIGDAAAGITGAFSLASQGVGLFGEESAEAFGKAEQQALQYIQAMEGIENVTKLFRGTTIATFKQLGGGFTKAIKSVKLFGLSSAASLTLATLGIGAIIAAIIALVSNFDKVTAKFNELADSIPFIDQIRQGFVAIGEAISFIDNLWDGLVGGLKSLGDETKSFSDGFKEALDASVEFEKNEEKLEKFRKEGVKDLQRQLKEAESLKDNDEEVFKLKEKILQTEIDLLKGQEKLNKEETENLKNLETELKVLENQEKTRLEQLKTEERKTKEAEEQKKAEEEITKALEAQQKVIEEIEKGEDRINEVVLRKRAGLLKAELNTLREKNNPLTDEQRILLETGDLRIKQFEVQQKINNLQSVTFENAEKEADKQREIASLENDKLEILIKIEEQAKKREELQEKEAAEQEEINKLLRDARNLKEDEEQAIRDQNVLLTNNFIPSLKAANDLLKEQYADWRENADAVEILQEQLAKAGLILNVIGDAFALGFEAALTSLDNQIISIDENLDKVGKQLEKIRAEEDAATSERLKNEQLLKDANGDRYREILNNLNKAKEAEAEAAATRKELELQEINLENQKITAQNEQAKIEKQQAIIESVIQTALAVVAALPNIPLSIIAGTLGAASTAIIASQKVPQQALISTDGFSDGGFTGEGDVSDIAGVVHKKEYVVPNDVLSTAFGAEMVALLEGIRTGVRGFAAGGYTSGTPTPSTPNTQLTASMNNQQQFVAVTEIERVANNVRVLETKSSL